MIRKPFAHQKKSLAHAKTTPVVFDCSDAGTGKTGVVVWDFESRRKKRGGCALILGPKSLLRSAWYNDFKKFAPTLKVVIATADVRGDAFNEDADVYVTNHDAAKWLARQPKSFFDKFDTLVVDESTAYKHATSQRSKAVAKITKHFKYRRAMTATPNSRSITDVWHQAYLLDDGKRLGNSFFKFRNSVCTPVQVGRHAQAIQWTDKDGAEEAVFGLLGDIVIRHKLDECADIPVNHRYELEYEMSSKQRKAYDQMEKDALLLLFPKGGVDKKKDGIVVQAANAAVVLNKLLQIASGAVYESTDKYHLVDNGRYLMTMDLVEERVYPLVFFHWKHQRDALVAEATKRKLKYGLIDGSVSLTMRNTYVQQYQAGLLDVMFAHPKSAAHGLTLTKGTSTIWVSPTADAELFEQGSKRQYRIGQTQKTEVITILAKDTQDERVYHEILVPKQKRMTNLLDLFSVRT
jgi:SNF2 family DNA or RNA helicase